MWCVFSPCDLHVDRRAEALRQRAEEVRHQFGRQAADGFARELAFEHRVGAAGQVDGDLRRASSIGSRKPIARDAALVAERLAQRLAERERAVLDGVVLVDLAGRPCRSVKAKPPCLATCSSMWSKKPMPVEIAIGAGRSRFTVDVRCRFPWSCA